MGNNVVLNVANYIVTNERESVEKLIELRTTYSTSSLNLFNDEMEYKSGMSF